MYKRSNGIYYTDFKGRDGKPVRLTTGTGNEREAKTKAKELEDKYWSGVLPVKGSQKPNGMTLKEAFQKVSRTAWRNLKSSDVYASDSLVVMSILGEDFRLVDVTQKKVAELKNKLYDKGYSIATVNNKLMCLSSMMTAAINEEWGEITSKPKFRPDEPNNARTRLITKAEEIQALQLADSELQDLLIVLMDTGMRVGEACRLRRAHIHVEKLTLQVFKNTKNDEPRAVPMSDRVAAVFSKDERQNGFKSTKDSFDKRFAAVRKTMGLEDDAEFVLHAYRHTCATRLLDEGVPIKTVKEWLGHESLASTERYAKLTTVQLDAARKALNRLNGSLTLRVVNVNDK